MRKKTVLISILALLILSAFAGDLHAADIRVPEDYSSIQQAINQASYGDRVLVSEGIYYEHIVMKEGVNLEGVDSANTIIDGSGSGTVILGADYCFIKNFTIQNGGPNGILCDNTSPTIEGNIIKGCWGSDGSGIRCINSFSIIKNNIIENNRWYGIKDLYGNITIEGNLIQKSNWDGIHSNGVNIIRNNTIIDNRAAGIYCPQSSDLTEGNTIKNNNYGIWIVGSIAAADLGGGARGSRGGNKIQQNKMRDVYNDSSNLIYAKYNIWDHKTELEIDSIDIYDDDEDPSKGIIEFWPACTSEGVIAIDPNGIEYPCLSVQEAVDIAHEDWNIEVGAGTYNELIVVYEKSGLTIKTACNAVVKGFKVQKSNYVTINGFEVFAEGTHAPGIFLMGGNNDNSYITISNCNIHSADNDYSGIKIARGNPNSYISNNYIHHNGRNGIVFIDANGGPHYVEENIIERNGWNGVNVARHHEIFLKKNTISENGTKSGSTGGRYGIFRERTSGIPWPEGITLIDNTIKNNNGKIQAGKSSIDLGNYDQILDSGDSGNCTTSGDEGTGVVICD